ncbi:hypothetical protein A6M21_00035 [Desulfotomaculum copahuensis]|uniref:ATPase BadF/BadG/BcrA/BcrD type domain-containing protein n=2 Tax=Desulfotomaculum copahuensis TaxID=1838280 RepID=A0A1B7LE01_9FIRM|nr:hypothetical protein A6M21_00035 [Desulfotomaculum copahuensis]
MDDDGILAYSVRSIDGNFRQAARQVMVEALDKCGLLSETLNVVGATGLGAAFVNDPAVRNTEISCQARGIHYLLPQVRTLIEIGDQSARVIKLTEKGMVADCVVNDKCAMGSGSVLQTIAKVLGINVTDMGELSLQSANPVRFSAGCSVFAETEAISRIAENARIEDIVAGLHQAMAFKIGSIAQKIKIESDVAVTGGGACNPGLVKMLEKTIGNKLFLPREPMFSGAIGAVLMALEKVRMEKLCCSN